MNRIKLLVVDDSILFREVLSRYIQLDDMIEVVGKAGDAYSARDMILQYEPDVMTLDLEMPKMDGLAFLKKLLPQYYISTIVVSGSDDQKAACKEAGAVEFISKPAARTNSDMAAFAVELCQTIRRAYKHSHPNESLDVNKVQVKEPEPVKAPEPPKPEPKTEPTYPKSEYKPKPASSEYKPEPKPAYKPAPKPEKPEPKPAPAYSRPSYIPEKPAPTPKSAPAASAMSSYSSSYSSYSGSSAAANAAHFAQAAQAVVTQTNKNISAQTPKLPSNYDENRQPAPSAIKHTKLKKSEAVIALGASTGGTEALIQVVKYFPPDTPPVIIVQHMPAGFTKMYAERLNRTCQMEVKEAEDGDRLRTGLIILGAGDYHLRLCRDARGYYVSSKPGERVSGHCPSVDVMFDSVADVAGPKAIGAIFTGMGRDGADGLLKMRKSGAFTIGQDKDTCVVYGMPMEAYNQGAVEVQAPLHKIAEIILSDLY